MAEVRAAQGMAAFKLMTAADVHVLFHPRMPFQGLPSLLHRSDFDADEEFPDKPRRDGRFAIADEDGWVEIFVGVRQWVDVMREALPIWEARLAEIEEAERDWTPPGAPPR